LGTQPRRRADAGRGGRQRAAAERLRRRRQEQRRHAEPRDGFISRAEARGNPYLEKRFKSADSNHDGKLNRAEYLAVMAKKDLSTAEAKTEHALDKPASKDSSR
jgi:hypothetical protein